VRFVVNENTNRKLDHKLDNNEKKSKTGNRRIHTAKADEKD